MEFDRYCGFNIIIYADYNEENQGMHYLLVSEAEQHVIIFRRLMSSLLNNDLDIGDSSALNLIGDSMTLAEFCVSYPQTPAEI